VVARWLHGGLNVHAGSSFSNLQWYATLSDTWAMRKRVKVPNVGVSSKVQAYAVLYRINHGFEQILAQLQQFDNKRTRRRLSKRLQLIVEETRAEVNFELVELLQERELSDWTRLGAARQRVDTRTKRHKN
jgi:hypothetical protein